MKEGSPSLRSGSEALDALEQLTPLFHPDPATVDGALENQFTSGPREVEGAGGRSYAIGHAVLRYLADIPPSQGTSVETGCGYTTVVLANVFATHICVNPDIASNRLVREFVERQCGATGLQHVEENSDQGLPRLVADGRRVELAVIDGNHSHPFPLLDFHYVDQMLTRDGLLLVDNIEIPAVQELTEYLEFERAYRLDQLIDNCAVYRKVSDRQFGWQSQTLHRPPAEVEPAVRELTRLRMEVLPDLRASLSGANPLPGWPDAVRPPNDAEAPPSVTRTSRRNPVSASGSTWGLARRRLRTLARWYRTPSGALAGVALVLLAAGFLAPGLWRLIGAAGVAVLALFLPYRFLREQRRTDRQIADLRTGLSRLDHRIEWTREAFRQETSEELATLRDKWEQRFDDIEARLKPSRRFTAAKPKDPRRLELTMRDATVALRLARDADEHG
jgi:hypothetical protein